MKHKSKPKRLETNPTRQTNNNNNLSLTETQSESKVLLLFPHGSLVEVSSDEEGFKGAWYSATVLQQPNKQTNSKILVEYKNLLSDENKSTLLTELVDSVFVRPRPPEFEEDKGVCFKLYDVVDAFYQDGWWSGVVTQVVEPGVRYKVFFASPPDEIEFGLPDLRVHRDWVHGKWVLPPLQRMRELNFSPGTAVEVNVDPDNSRDVWFPASFVKQVGNNSFLVEYQSSGEEGLQKVAVDSLHIRPSPPSSSNNTFNLLEKVDAFHDCRWLSGVVTKILADGRYIVYFRSTKKEKELCHADLRVHMEWTNGKWVQSSQDTSKSSHSEKRSGHANGGYEESIRAPSEDSGVTKENNGEGGISAVTLKSCQKESQTSGSEKANHNSKTPCNKRTRQASANGDAISSRSSRRLSEQAASDVPLSPETCISKMKQTEGSSNGTTVIPGDSNQAMRENTGEGGISAVTLKNSQKETQTSGSAKANYNSKTPSNKRIKQATTNGDAIFSRSSGRFNEEAASDVPLSPETCKSKIKLTDRSSNTATVSQPGNSSLKRTGDSNHAMKETTGEGWVSAVTLKSCQKELQTSGSETAHFKGKTPSNKRIKEATAIGDGISSRSSRRLNEEAASDMPLSPETGILKIKQTEGSSNGTTVTPGQPGNSGLKQSGDINQPSDSTEIEIKGDYERYPATRRRGRPAKLRLLVPDTVDQTSNRGDILAPLGPIVVGLTHNGKMIDSRAEKSGLHPKLEQKRAVEEVETHLATSADHESVVSDESEPQKEGEVTDLKRKRGRPPKALHQLGSPEDKEEETGEKESKDVVDVDEVEKSVAVVEPAAISDSTPSTDSHTKVIISDQFKRVSDIHRLSTRCTKGRQGRKRRKIPKLTAVVDLTEPAKAFSLKLKGRKLKQSKLLERAAADAVNNSGERALQGFSNGVARGDVGAVTVTSSNASDDDKPLSTWFEGAQSPLAIDARAAVTGTAGRNDETGERKDENETPPGGNAKDKIQEKRDESTSTGKASSGNDVPERQDETPTKSTTAIVTRENPDLPFVKNSLIWEMIESMEVLKWIPQRPHFRPLYNCKEECREGLAIGSMVTFTSLVERVSRACFDDPKSLLDGYLEALVDLEDLGFNVEPVREQLSRLLSIKGRCEQAQNTTKQIETQISERKHERSKINDEIAEFEKQIADLREKQALAVSKRERKDSEIALLQSSVDALKVNLESAQKEFEKITASLW